MKKVLFFAIFIVIVVGLVLIIDQGIMKKEKSEKTELNSQENNVEIVREPVAAGQFYPENEAELSKMIDNFLEKTELPELNKYIHAMIVPHAGYVYSGQTAAYGYKTLEGRDIKTIILIGNSHQEYFDGVSVYEKGYYKTPLGKVEIDANLAKKIIDSHEKIFFKESVHIEEHSLEVQLPFLQKVFSAQGGPATDWKIVPIIIGNQPGVVDILINVLKPLIDNNTLLIASSDLSHYPDYEDAQYSDNKVIKAILTGNPQNLTNTVFELRRENIQNLQTCACGQDAIMTLMGLFGDKNIKLLKYTNSGEISEDKSRVVGYATIVFMSNDSLVDSEIIISEQEQKRLLEIARESLESYIKEGKIKKFEESDSALNKEMGVFVTLKKHGQLRGCIGVFSARGGPAPGGELLYQNVADMAIAAAINDPRFNPVTKEELEELEYEISVLSLLKKVDSWKDIEIGKHGVKIVNGVSSGVFLPQVAVENNWDLDTFMSILCTQKADLSSDCWKNPETEIYIFTAQVFGEN